MSYRTKVDGTQIFGNGESYPEWIEFIKSQGITVNDENMYKGKIYDFMGMLEVAESIVLKMEKERTLKRDVTISEMTEKGFTIAQIKESLNRKYGVKSVFDFTDVPKKIETQNEDDEFNTSLFDEIFMCTESAYAFVPYTLYIACKNKLERADHFSTDGHLHCFKIKSGKSITVEAR